MSCVLSMYMYDKIPSCAANWRTVGVDYLGMALRALATVTAERNYWQVDLGQTSKVKSFHTAFVGIAGTRIENAGAGCGRESLACPSTHAAMEGQEAGVERSLIAPLETAS